MPTESAEPRAPTESADARVPTESADARVPIEPAEPPTPDRRPLVAVGAIAVHDGALLMVRRAKAPAEGLWTVPGGHVEGGEYLAEAVRREVREETGLEVEVRDLVGIFEVLSETHFVILDFFAEVTGDPTPTTGTDVSEVAWVPLDDVSRLECTPRFVETMRAWGVLPSADEQSY